MRVVTDTNVLFAAFVSTQGTCAQLLEVLLEGHTLVLSSHILSELREHLVGKRRLNSVLVDEQIAFLESSAVMVNPSAVPADTISDPDDLPVLGTAIAGQADCLVTGDKELLKLGSFHSIAILSPRAFYDRLRAE